MVEHEKHVIVVERVQTGVRTYNVDLPGIFFGGTSKIFHR